MADSNNEDMLRRLEAQEQSMKDTQQSLNDIKLLLAQLTLDRNTGPVISNNDANSNANIGGGNNTNAGNCPNINTGGSGEDRNTEEERISNEPPKTDSPVRSDVPSASAVSPDVIWELQAQITFLAQRDGVRQARMIRPYPLEWDSVAYPPKYKPLSLHSYDGKGSPIQHMYYFRSQVGNMVGNDPIMTRLYWYT